MSLPVLHRAGVASSYGRRGTRRTPPKRRRTRRSARFRTCTPAFTSTSWLCPCARCVLQSLSVTPCFVPGSYAAIAYASGGVGPA